MCFLHSMMATETDSWDFFVGDDDENDSQPLTSESDGGTEDTNSLSSLDCSDSDGISHMSMDSMGHPDSEDEEEGCHPLMSKGRRECPISPEKQVTLPNFLQVPTSKKRARSIREHSPAFSATTPFPTSSNSPKSLFNRHDSKAVLLLDETASPHKVRTIALQCSWSLFDL